MSACLPNPATTRNRPQHSKQQPPHPSNKGCSVPRRGRCSWTPSTAPPGPSEDRGAEQRGALAQQLSFHLGASPSLSSPGRRTHHSQVLIIPARRLGGRSDARRSAGGLGGHSERQLALVAINQNGSAELHAAPHRLEIRLAT